MANSKYALRPNPLLFFINIAWLILNNRYEYVKAFEQPDVLLPNTWIVVRIDGRGFHKLVAVLPPFLPLKKKKKEKKL